MSRSKVLSGLAIVAGAVVIASGFAIADAPISDRKEKMKAIGGATKQSVQMVKGEIPFDAAKAKSNMDAFAVWTDMPTLFPKGSEAGDTTAAPKIWQTFDDFDAKSKKLVADAMKAKAAADQGKEAFATAFADVAKNCKSCHQDYRVRK